MRYLSRWLQRALTQRWSPLAFAVGEVSLIWRNQPPDSLFYQPPYAALTWRDLEIGDPEEGTITNFEKQPVAIVLRIEAPTVPLGTVFELSLETTVSFQEFEPQDIRQMDVDSQGTDTIRLTRADSAQQWLTLRADLPSALQAPFEAAYTLRLTPPGGTSVGTTFNVSIDQIEVDEETGLLGDLIGGNTYQVILE